MAGSLSDPKDRNLPGMRSQVTIGLVICPQSMGAEEGCPVGLQG